MTYPDPDDFTRTVQDMSSKDLGRLDMSQYTKTERRIINDELVRRSDERKARNSKVATKKRKTVTSWSMYPELVEDVEEKMRKPYTFYNVDDGLHALKEYDTFVCGVFLCKRRCSNRSWFSGKIAISIRLYDRDQYNVRVHHQRCRGCDALSRPKLDAETYGERVSYRLNLWSGFKIRLPRYKKKKTLPHDCEKCEGCDIGRCPHDKDKEEYVMCRRHCRSDP
ncbi:hypothetical protein MVEG_10413 [Podila verticillata NRRL 6337]|nr:hypothetical protein MVEG_10413 [Podila verticillata NRRL 6337]